MKGDLNKDGKMSGYEKKRSKAIQKAILKKMKEDGKITKEEADAAYSKLLSKDDQPKEEVGPEGELKKVDNPKEPKSSEKHDA